jgi:hypothetical protein
MRVATMCFPLGRAIVKVGGRDESQMFRALACECWTMTYYRKLRVALVRRSEPLGHAHRVGR